MAEGVWMAEGFAELMRFEGLRKSHNTSKLKDHFQQASLVSKQRKKKRTVGTSLENDSGPQANCVQVSKRFLKLVTKLS